MGQAASTAEKRRPGESRKRVALVDLDNCVFGLDGSEMDGKCLGERIWAIAQRFEGHEIHFFCNPATEARVMQKLPGPLHVTDSDAKDAADHLLLHHLVTRYRSAKHAVCVVTRDKILARLATYLVSEKERDETCALSFGLFGKKTCTRLEVEPKSRFVLLFNDAADLDAFVESLELYRKRSAAASAGTTRRRAAPRRAAKKPKSAGP